MKNRSLILLLTPLLLLSAGLSGQCSFTTSIAVSGPTTGCGTATLTAGTAGNTWTTKSVFGGGTRYMAASFSIGTKGYVGTGSSCFSAGTNDFWEYDPSTNVWTQKAVFPGTARYGAVGLSIGTKGYIGCGHDGNGYKSDFYEYDPSTNLWTARANFSGGSRYLAVGFGIGSKGYIGTGDDSNLGYTSDFWEYDPSTNFWTSKNPIPGNARYSAIGFAIGNKGYIGSGLYNYSNALSDFYEFDPSTGLWTTKASLTNPVYGAAGFVIGNYGYLATGYEINTNTMSDKLWMFDPAANTWIQGPSMGTGMYYASAFSIGSKGFIAGGSDASSCYNTTFEYDAPGTYQWSNGATTQSIAVSGVTTYSVLLTNAAACTATASQVLNLSQSPNITVSGASLSCAGTANTLVASGAGTYTWSSNAGSGNSASVVLSPTLATTYTVSGTTGSCTTNYPVNLMVNPSPTSTISASGATVNCGVLTLSTSVSGDTWTQKSGLNTGRKAAVGFSIGNKGYIGTGYSSNYPNAMSDFWEYDPAANTWTQKAVYPGGSRYWATGFSIGNKGYIGSGLDAGNNLQNDFWEYDPAGNAWTSKSPVPGSNRAYAIGLSIGNKGYIGLGYNGNYPYFMSDFYEFDPSLNTWTAKPNFPGTARYGAVAFAVGSKGYVGTGQDINNYTSDFYEYDPASGSWTAKASFPGGGIYMATGFGLGSSGYLGTGNTSNNSYNNLFWEFKPASNTWTQKGNFPGTARQIAVSFAIGSKGYLATGLSGSYLNDIWEYIATPVVNWSTGSTLQAITVASSGSYSVTVSDVSGCSSSSSQSVSLSPNPTITVSGASISCSGISNTLIASGASTYTWSSNAGSSNSGTATVTPTANTVYTVSGTTGSCTVSYQVGLTVNSTPIATIAVSGATAGCGIRTLSTSASGNAWTQKQGLNTGRYSGVAFAIGNKGYCGTGYISNSYPNYYTNDFWEFDPATNTWTQKANFGGTARFGAVGFSIGSKGYIGTGYDLNNGLNNDFYEFDPAANTWTQKAAFPGAVRTDAAGFSIGAKGYIGTGSASYTYYSDFYEYDPATNGWTQKTSFIGTGRFGAVGFNVGSKGYIGLGQDYNVIQNDMYEYDPAANSWATKNPFPGGGSQQCAAFSIGSKGYIGTGYTNYNNSSDFWEFDPSANNWTQRASFAGIARQSARGFAIGGRGYIGTGSSNSSPNFMNDLWEYEPVISINWSTGATVSAIQAAASGNYSVTLTSASGCSASGAQSLSLSPNPTITVSGNSSAICTGTSGTLTASGASSYTWSANAGSAVSPSVIITPTANATYTVSGTSGTCTVNYPVLLNTITSPVANIITIGSPSICGTSITLSTTASAGDTWTQKSGLNVGRSQGIAFAIGSKGYVGLGYNSVQYPFASFDDLWEYDPGNNTWTQKASFSNGPRYSAVGFSIGNKGYVGTGFAVNSSNYTNDLWEFDPAANTWTPKAAYPGGSRYDATGFSIGSKGYIGLGNDGYNSQNDFYEYDPSLNTWTQKASLALQREAALGFSIGNKGYLGLGYSTYYNVGNEFYEYDPASNSWTQKSSPGASYRYGGIGFSIGNYGFVTGGDGSNDVWQFNPALNSWIQKANFGGATRNYGVAFSINGKGYMGTGYSSNYTVLNDNWEYTPSLNTLWSNGSSSQSMTAISSGTYNLTLTDLSGCTNIASQVLTITPTPTVTISGPGSICANNTLSLTAGGATNYTWSTNAGSAATNTVSVIPTVNASYVVIGATNGCTATASKPVIVYSLPAVSANTSSSSVCQGFNITLHGGGAATYAWTGNATDNVPFAPLSTGNYTVTGTDLNACTNTAVVSVTVLPSPTISVNSGAVCAGESFTMAPSGGLTYSYSNGSDVVTPGSTASYTVTGYNSIGCPNPMPAISTVTVNPLPVILISDDVVCIGSSYTLNPAGAATYTYSSGLPVVTPTVNSSYTISGTSAFGCLSAGPAVVNLSISVLPTVAVTGGTVCSGQNFTLTPSGAVNYTYSSGSAIVSPTTNTSYTVTGSNVYGCVSAAAAVANMTVLVSPTVSVNSGAICAGKSFTLVPTGGLNYIYSGGSDVVTPTANTSYTVTGFNAIGCPNAALAIADITVNALPVIVQNSTVVCTGDSFTFTPAGAATYTYSSGTDTVTPVSTADYSITGTSPEGCVSAGPTVVTLSVSPLPTLSVNSGSICSGQNFIIVPAGASSYTFSDGSATVSPAITTSYTVTGANIYGCLALLPAISQVSISATPTIALPSTVVICTGNSFTMNPTGADSYTFSGGNPVVTPNSTTSYTVNGASNSGCQAANVVITVSVAPSLNVSISGTNVTCSGYSVTLIGNGASTYTWSNGSTGYSISVTPTANVTYSVSAGNTGCSGSASFPITVKPSPAVTLVASSTVICLGDSVILDASGANSYVWGDGSTGPELIRKPIATKDYSVTGTGPNGCTSMAVLTESVTICDGIANNGGAGYSIKAYPNPNNGVVTVKSDNFPSGASVLIYDYLGQLIHKENMSANNVRIDFSNTANGIYTLQVISKNKLVYVTKLVKE